MRSNQPLIMSWLAVYEGGYVNHPEDPGGATNRGVTQRVYDAFRRRQNQATRSVKHLTDAEHDAIYLAQYWLPIRADELPAGIDATVFDIAVHSGVSRAAKMLQQALGVRADGIIGEQTLAAVQDAVRLGNVAPLIVDINRRRMAFLRRLKHWKTFGKGWTTRVVGRHEGVQEVDIGVVDRSVMLARGRTDMALPKNSAGGKADDRDLSFIGNLIEAVLAFIQQLFRKGETS